MAMQPVKPTDYVSISQYNFGGKLPVTSLGPNPANVVTT